ncbi:MAG TPA: hypothetical protein VHL58_17235 [Thermoanaerobaculia bacterium]|nr:hypothetical protein [Thermoanaerobaculia bacterium]
MPVPKGKKPGAKLRQPSAAKSKSKHNKNLKAVKPLPPSRRPAAAKAKTTAARSPKKTSLRAVPKPQPAKRKSAAPARAVAARKAKPKVGKSSSPVTSKKSATKRPSVKALKAVRPAKAPKAPTAPKTQKAPKAVKGVPALVGKLTAVAKSPAITVPKGRPATPAGKAPVTTKAHGPKQRRPRARITREAGPLAAWIPEPNGTVRRSASFIPAPPRAESAFTTAAPPASSDRLFREGDVDAPAVPIRTYPVRVDIEQSAGRFYVATYPSEVMIKRGDGVEWDFRYIGGADVIVEDVVVEFGKPAPFVKGVFKSQKPGSARPHRLLSGATIASATAGRMTYRIRCLNHFKTEVTAATSTLVVT